VILELLQNSGDFHPLGGLLSIRTAASAYSLQAYVQIVWLARPLLWRCTKSFPPSYLGIVHMQAKTWHIREINA